MRCTCEQCGKKFDAEPVEEPAVHQILVGDSMNAEDVSTLMGGKTADLCFTSPPYDQQRTYESGIGDWLTLMKGVFGNLPMAEAGQVLVNLGLIHRDGEWQPYWEAWIAWMREQGWRRFGWYVWDQGPGLPGDWGGRLAPSFEFVFHFNRAARRPDKARKCLHAGQRHGGKGLRSVDGEVTKRTHGTSPVQESAILDSVIRVNRQGSSAHAGGHPAPFPSGLPTAIIKSWPGDVFDPFLGSGTTIVAAEQNARHALGIEISPAYVAVCLERLAGLGLEPRLESSRA
jgi:DNA modification methylase